MSGHSRKALPTLPNIKNAQALTLVNPDNVAAKCASVANPTKPVSG